jgi:hypothetical protein
MAFRAVQPDGLPDLVTPENADQPGAEKKGDQKRRDRGVDRPERDIAEYVEERIALMERK